MQDKQQMIDALLAERQVHVTFNRQHHIRLVDAELEKLGCTAHQAGGQPDRPAAAANPSAPPIGKQETTRTAAASEPALDRSETAVQAPPEHTAEPRPTGHACDQCSRTFATAAALGAHRRSHRRKA